jgi:DNA-binding IscR family transcriptional regulator
VNSKKGKGGGFYFDRLQPALPIREIIVSIEGDSLLGGCGFGLKNCNEESPCPLHGSFAPIRSALNRVVSEQTIQSLAAGLQKPAPSA